MKANLLLVILISLACISARCEKSTKQVQSPPASTEGGKFNYRTTLVDGNLLQLEYVEGSYIDMASGKDTLSFELDDETGSGRMANVLGTDGAVCGRLVVEENENKKTTLVLWLNCGRAIPFNWCNRELTFSQSGD